MHTKDSAVTGTAQQILNQVRQAVVGKDTVLLWVLAAILAKGHILLEDIPGVGKTTMALAFSKVLDLDYSRVQFTPDVLPSDVTGYSVPDPQTHTMHYQPGAVLTNLFLADELNRAAAIFAAEAARFAEMFPEWERMFEQMMVNHAFFEGFPFVNEQESLWQAYISLCAAGAFVRLLAVMGMAEKQGEERLVDVCAAAFRLIEHSGFDRNAAALLESRGVSAIEELAKLTML